MKKPDVPVQGNPHPSPIPSKEASEEKKASLKDLLAKVTSSQASTQQSIQKENELPSKPVPEATKTVITEPIKIVTAPPQADAPEVVSTPIIPITKKVDDTVNSSIPKPVPEIPKVDIPLPQNKSDTWKKQQPSKEVPEDVLRKVLE